MPSLTYNQQTSVDPAMTPADARGGQFTPAVGQAVEQLGREGGKLSADYQHLQYMQQEADGVAQLQKNISDGYKNFTESLDNWKSDPDIVQQNGSGLTDKLVGTYQGWSDQLVNQQTTPRLKRMAAEQSRTMGDHFFNQAHTWEVETNRAWRVNSVDESINTDASTLDAHPEMHDDLLKDKLGAIEALKGLHPADYIALSNKTRATYAEAASLGRARLDPQGTVNVLMGGQPLPSGSIQSRIAAGAKAAGVDPNTALAIVSRETGGTFDPTINNQAGSSAHGLFQTLSSTWNQYAPPGADPNNPDVQIAVGSKLTADNQAALTKALGRAPTPGELLAAHQFGLGGARALLKAPDALPFSSLVAQYDPKNAAATVQQNALTGMTVGDVKAQMDRQMASNMAKTAGFANAPAQGESAKVEDMPSYFQQLTPQGRQAILSHAQTLLHKDDSEAKMTLQARIKDTMSAYQRGDNPANPPQLGDYTALYPASVATRMYNDQVGWQQFGADVGAGKGLPYAEQQALLSARNASLNPSAEGYAESAQRVDALGKAFQWIDDQRKHDPIYYAQNMGGGLAKQLDFTNPDTLTGPLNARFIQADQISKSYATNYQPFSTGEAQQLGEVLNKAPTAQARQYLSSIAAAADTPEHFKAAMQQLAPNNPTLAVAGQLSQSWKPGQPDAASIILAGERILHPSKGDKEAEGKFTKIPLPEIGGQKGLRQNWEQQVGQAYGQNQQSSAQDFNAALAYYVGRVPPGEQSEQVNEKVWQEAIATVAPHTTHAGQPVLVPPGTNPAQFSNSVAKVWPTVMAAHGLDPAQYPSNAYPLVSLPDGSYAVASGTSTLYGADGNPVRFSLTDTAIKPVPAQNQDDTLPPAAMPKVNPPLAMKRTR